MSSPISGSGNTPDVPPTGPQNPFGPQTPGQITFNSSLIASNSTISLPPIAANTPTIPLIDYYGSISEAQLLKQLQDFLTNFENQTKLNGMWQDASQQASALRDFINEIWDYVHLQDQLLGTDNFTDKETAVNGDINTYNAGVPSDQDQVDAMNQAINDFNSAQTTYNQALQDYNSAVTTQQNAQAAYNTALQNWNTALQKYNNGQISQAELQDAQSTFTSAQNTFNTAQSNFDNAQSTYNTAASNYQTALSNFESARTTYNDYVASRNPQIDATNQSIAKWNTFANKENAKITQLNAIRASLDPPLPPIPLVPTVDTIPELQTVSDPGVDPIEGQVEQNIQNYNSSAAASNSLIDNQINPTIATINGNGYTPPIDSVPDLSTIPDITSFPLGSGIATLPTPGTVSPVNYVLPTAVDVVTIYLEPRLQLLGILKQSNIGAQRFSNYLDNAMGIGDKIPDHAGRQNTLGGLGANVQLTTLGRNATVTSPYLESILSNQLYESIINAYGARAASPLVGWSGALAMRVMTYAGLLSAGPGNKILDTATTYDNIKGQTVINVAVSLGFLKQITNVTSSEFLPQSVLGFINGDPKLSTLDAAEKEELVQLISGDLKGNLLQFGLAEVARSLGLPGLAPQILANVGTAASGPNTASLNALASLGGQLYAETVLGQELAKLFELSNIETDQISKTALQDSIRTNGEVEKGVLVASVQSQLAASGITGKDVQTRVQQAIDALEQQIIHDHIKEQDLQKDAFRHELAFRLQQTNNSDGKEAFKTADRILSQGNSLAQLNQAALTLLPKQGLTDAETASIVNSAISAYTAKQPSSNPLSSFTLAHIGTPEQLAGAFKTSVKEAIAPIVGNTKAADVAESYANLIFSNANSILNTFQDVFRHEKEFLVKKNVQNIKNRENDRYIEATKLYRDPGTFAEHLTSPAKALLATSSVGGPSLQGATFMDNNVGRTGHYRHPTDIAV